MPADVEQLLRTYDVLKAERQPWMPSWQMLADTMAPALNDILQMRQPGQSRTADLFDTTAMVGAKHLADQFMGHITNFQTQWFLPRMRLKVLNAIKPVAQWTEASGETMLDAMTASPATVPSTFHEFFRQLVLFGTGAMFVDEVPLGGGFGFQGLLSRSLPIGTYCVAEDAKGQVDSMYRELDLSPRQAMQQFGVNALAPETRHRLEHRDLAHKPMPYLHAVYPRQDRQPFRDEQANAPWASIYVDVGQKHLVSEGGYRWFPYMVSRWEKLRSWSPWGFGPGHLALPETLTLNRMDKDVLKALQVHILPPYWTDDEDAAGRISLLPGAVNPIGKGHKIEAMRAGGDFNITRLGMEERRQRIRQIFMMDTLQLLPDPNAPGTMTAYEVSQRMMLMLRLMGPALMRLLSELLNPFMDTVFGLLLLAGELPEPPDEVYQAAEQNQGRLDIEYQGPLARAQKSEEIDAIHGTLEVAERIAKGTGDLAVYDNFDMDEVIRRTGKVYGIPASILRDPRQVLQTRQQRADAQAEAQQAEALRADADAVGKVAPTLKELMPAREVAA